MGVSTVISQRQLRNDDADVMRRVEQGETFVVTRHGRPVADLVPHLPSPAGPRRFVPIAEPAVGYGALSPIDTLGWYADRDELQTLSMTIQEILEPVAGMSVARHPVALPDTSVVIAFDPASAGQRRRQA